jgi:hypothetical protein
VCKNESNYATNQWNLGAKQRSLISKSEKENWFFLGRLALLAYILGGTWFVTSTHLAMIRMDQECESYRRLQFGNPFYPNLSRYTYAKVFGKIWLRSALYSFYLPRAWREIRRAWK